MAKINPEYLRRLDALLDNSNNTNEDETIFEEKYCYLLTLVIQENLIHRKDEILNLLKTINEVIGPSWERSFIQTSINYCGVVKEISPFEVGWNKNIRYIISNKEAKENYLYDVIVQSAKNIMKQSSLYAHTNYKRCIMIIIADGKDEKFENDIQAVRNVIEELKENEISCLCTNFASDELKEICKVIPPKVDFHELQRLMYMVTPRWEKLDEWSQQEKKGNFEYTQIYVLSTNGE